MSTESHALPEQSSSKGTLPEGEEIRQNVRQRQSFGRIWQGVFFVSTGVGLVILLILLGNVTNDAFGGVAIQAEVEEETLTGGLPLDELDQTQLIAILETNLRSRVIRNLERSGPLTDRNEAELIEIINAEIIRPETVGTYKLFDYLTNREAIEAQLREDFPRAELEFRSWISGEFLTTPMSSNPVNAGVRTALLGSMWMLVLTIIFAFPLGIGTAIYLEEYSNTKVFDGRTTFGKIANGFIERVSGLIQVNIYNLSGVPSIIYGMLGLAIFVRALEGFTSGRLFGGDVGDATANGRTVIAAAMTMSLLVLPVVIISAQEAIRSVPSSLRQASLGLGATKLQTIWKIVLPNAMPGILTGTILAVSRAVGETAPLVVVGASTFILTDPEGPFSKFTALPIQIYNWTARPQDEYRSIAAAAIITLLTLLLSMNLVAILLRNYLRSRRVS